MPHSTESIQRNTLHNFCSGPSASAKMTFSVAVWFPAGQDTDDGKHFKMPDWGKLRITWTTASTPDLGNGLGCRSIDHFSMLPFGWIPEDGVEFLTQFMLHLKERWLKLCDLADQHLADCVSEFLQQFIRT